jgi:hypothetical protein
MFLEVKYKGFWFWKRAYIFDGVRWLKMDKELTTLQIKADKLFAKTEIFLENLK